MRISIPCTTCLLENNNSKYEFHLTELNDNGSYKIVCPSGHETVTAFKQVKFQILYEIGANAILDGYYREAVSSFTSSLERFYEFSIEVLVDNESSTKKSFEDCWKKVSNQSERQLGAFIFLWLSKFDKCPETLPQKMVEFRNSVIHKGKIPTKAEAIEYGDVVLRVINEQMQSLNTLYTEQVDNFILRDVVKSYPKEFFKSDESTRDGISASTMNLPTILEIKHDDLFYFKKTLTTHLASLEEARKKSILHNNLFTHVN